MATKNFDSITAERQETGIRGGAAYETIGRGNDKRGQTDPTEEEKRQRADNFETRGRKGCKEKRLNMAFTPDNMLFVRVMAQVTGKSQAQFVNAVMDQYRADHPELFAKAKAFIDEVNGAGIGASADADS